MEAEKIHLIEYQCPSCGADLHYREDQFMITCKYCGARVERKLDRKAQDKVYARQQLEFVKQYHKDMDELKRLQNKRESAKKRVQLCSQNVFVEPKFLERCPYIVFLAVVPVLIFVLILTKGSTSTLILSGLIAAVALIVYLVEAMHGREKMQIAAEAKGRIDQAQKELVQSGNELEEFEKQFDQKAIPKQYRDDDTLKYLEHIFETAQAATLGEGLKMCDEYHAQKRLEEIKNEELAMVKMKLEHRPDDEPDYIPPTESQMLALYGGASRKTTGSLFNTLNKAKKKMNDKKG